MEYYTDIINNEILPFAAAGMYLDNMLGEICQRKSNAILHYLYVESRKKYK